MKATGVILLALGATGALAQSFSEELGRHPELSNMRSYLESNPDLMSMFESPTDVTILAPENNAFSVLTGPMQDNQPLANASLIQGILQYHVVNGTHERDDFEDSEFIHTHLTQSQFQNVSDGQVIHFVHDNDRVNCISGLNARSQLTGTSARYNNGIIHIIDNVLTLPQSVTSTLFAANLTAALSALNMGGNAARFNESGNITVFAPRNEGFERIASHFETLQTLQTENQDLRQIVSHITDYHMVTGRVLYSTEMTNETLSTLAGEDVHFSVIDGVGYVNSARLVSTDILLNNGVLHVISDVLNPDNSTAQPDPGADVQPVAFAGASSGSLGPLTSGQPSPTSAMPLSSASSIDAAEPTHDGDGGATTTGRPPPATTGDDGAGGGAGGTATDGAGGGGAATETAGSPGAGPVETARAGLAAALGIGALLLT